MLFSFKCEIYLVLENLIMKYENQLRIPSIIIKIHLFIKIERNIFKTKFIDCYLTLAKNH